MGLDRKTVNAYVEKFTTTTVIRVFNYIRTSTFLVERIFWIAVLVGFAAATVWNLSQTVSTFLSEGSGSQVSYVNNVEKGLNFPDAVICLPLNPDALQQRMESRELFASLKHPFKVMQDLKNKLNAVYEREKTELARIKNAPCSRNDQKLYFNYDYLRESDFSKTEVQLIVQTAIMFDIWLGLEMKKLNKTLMDFSPVMGTLYGRYANEGTNFTLLFDITTQLFCGLHRIRVVMGKKSNNDYHRNYMKFAHACNAKHALFYGYLSEQTSNTLCYNVSNALCYNVSNALAVHPLRFNSAADFVIVAMQPQPLYGQLLHAASELEPIAIDFGGTLSPEHRLTTVALGEKQTVEFSLDTINVLLDLRRRPCVERNALLDAKFQCDLACRAEYIIRSCACLPLYSHFLPVLNVQTTSKEVPVCFSTVQRDDESCLLGLRANFSTIRKSCSRKCEDPCETWIFSSTVRRADPAFDAWNASTVIQLVSSNFLQQYVEEYLKLSPVGLVSALGGNLSLFLGASFLALIHIVVFIVKVPFEYAYGTSNTTSAAPPPLPPAQPFSLEAQASTSMIVAPATSTMQSVVGGTHDARLSRLRQLELRELALGRRLMSVRRKATDVQRQIQLANRRRDLIDRPGANQLANAMMF